MMNQSRFRCRGPLGWTVITGAVAAMTPACGTENVSSLPGASGSNSTKSAGNVAGGNNGVGGSNVADPATGGVTTTSSQCAAGTERCACYGNGTCDAGLVCASQRCVNAVDLLSAAGGAPATNTTNNLATGGATETGGAASAGASNGTASATGGSVASGGTSTGGAAPTGGAPASGGSMATGGASATGGAFWKNVTYSATALPNPSNGNHNAGQNCIQCHTAGNGEAPIWLFGGTVYQADGKTPAAHVQVGVNDGTNLYTAYSATNGNFWFGGTGNIRWSTAQVRLRNTNGELTMAGATPASTCNLCHNATTYPRITAP